MAEPLMIICPNCKVEFKLTDSLAEPIIEQARQDFQRALKEKDSEIAQREIQVAKKEQALTEERRALDERIADRVAEQVATERERILAEATINANLKVSAEQGERERQLKALQDAFEAQRKKLTDAQRAQLDLSQKKRELETKLTEADLLVEKRVQEQLSEARQKAAAEAQERTRLELSSDLNEHKQRFKALEDAFEEQRKKLIAAQQTELELSQTKRELETRLNEVDLTVEKRVQEQLEPLREKAASEAKERANLGVRERDIIIDGLRKQITDLQRRVEQGSQQLQGEAQELELEEILASTFPVDTLVPVPKGERGADIVEHVVGSGRVCGSILWESKRTKNWSDEWLAKIRGDQREANADICVLVSQALPKGITGFQLIEGVWVTSWSLVVPVASMLRQGILRTAFARGAAEGQKTKAELLYKYLTGNEFTHRISALVEGFRDLQGDLAAERRVMNKQWAKRAKHIDSVVVATAGLFGDVSGIVGKSFVEIEALSLTALEPADSRAEEEGEEDEELPF